MKIEFQSLEELEQYFLNLLSHIYIWSEKIDKYIIDEKDYLKKNIQTLDGISRISNLSFQPIISKYSKITPAILIEMKKSKPEEFEKINSHINLIFKKSRNDVLLSLTEEIFSSITWSSLFLTTISSFEHCLITATEYLSIENKFMLKVNDLSGHSIYEKFKNYCTKVLELEYDFSSILWRNIINHKNVRNIVVHSNGYLDNDEKMKKIENIIKSSNTSLLLKDNRVIVNKAYLQEVIINIQDWMEDYFKKI